METITLTPEDKKLLEEFIGYTLPDVISWNEIMPIVDKIEEFTETVDREVKTTWFHILGKGSFVKYGR